MPAQFSDFEIACELPRLVEGLRWLHGGPCYAIGCVEERESGSRYCAEHADQFCCEAPAGYWASRSR